MIALCKKLLENETISSLFIMGLRGGMLVAKFLLGIFIARYLGLAELGVYGLIVGASAIGQVVMRMGVFAYLARRAVYESLEELTNSLRHYGLMVLVFYLAAAPIAALFGNQFEGVTTLLLALAIIATEHLVYDIFILSNNLQKPKLANFILFVQSASWIYLFMVFSFFFESLRNMNILLGSWLAGGLITIIFSAFLTRHWPWPLAFSKKIDLNWYKDNIFRAFKLYISEVLNMLTLYMDRYLITALISIEIAGVYVLFWQVTNAICNLVNAGVMQIYRPRFVILFKEMRKEEFQDSFQYCVKRTLLGTFGLILISGIIVPFIIPFANQPLAENYIHLLWLMLAALPFRVGADLARLRLYAFHRDGQFLAGNAMGLLLLGLAGTISLILIGVYGAVLTSVIINVILILLFSRKTDVFEALEQGHHHAPQQN